MLRPLQKFCCVVGLFSTGCGDSAPKPSVWDRYQDERGARPGADNPKCVFSGEVSVGSRKVKTVADVSLSTEFHGEIVEVLLGARTVKVDFGQNLIYIDGKENAKLLGDAKLVEVRFLADTLSLSADGATLPLLTNQK